RRAAAEGLGDARGLDDRAGGDKTRHRVNAVAGSTRITRRIAARPAPTHMMTASPNSAAISTGVITIGSALPAVAHTTASATSAAIAKPISALNTAWHTITA